MWSVSDFEFKRDVVGNELIVGALNPVDFERSRDTVSGKILQPCSDHHPVVAVFPHSARDERPLPLNVPDLNLTFNRMLPGILDPKQSLQECVIQWFRKIERHWIY